MTFTVLFDLDDTLLANEMGVFLPAYFQALQDSLADLVPPDQMMPYFLAASQQMMGNDRPDRTLMDAFFTHFLPGLSIPLDELMPAVSRFYRQDYLDLQAITGVVPDAQQAVATFEQRGYRMAIATNPLFPEVAVRARLDWAQLPVPPSGFDLITNSEDFHFAKPRPAFLAEILAQMGWPEGPVLVVGNDPSNDVQCAVELGLAAYHVVAGRLNAGRPVSGPVQASGPLAELVPWIDSLPADAFTPDYHSIKAVRAILLSTAAALHTFTAHFSSEAWASRLRDEWTAQEVLHHLADVDEKVNLPRIRMIKSEGRPFIPGVDTDSWYLDGFAPMPDVLSSFNQFMRIRYELLEALETLSLDDWGLPARHAILGPTDLLELTFIMAKHDQLHVRQIRDLLTSSEKANRPRRID